MRTVVAGLSNERLEDLIAAEYQEAARVAPGVALAERGLLALYWAEFDLRFREGLIPREPVMWEEDEDW